MIEDKALTNIASTQIFTPYFRGREDLYKGIINDEAWKAAIPDPYKTYYYTFIRSWWNWATGYVPRYHKDQLFTYGMGYTVCDIFVREIMHGGWRISTQNPRLYDLVTQNTRNLNDELNRVFFYSNSLGNGFLTITNVDGKPVIGTVPTNRIYFQMGRGSEMSRCVILNRFTAGDKSVYAKETRIRMGKKCYYKVNLFLVQGTETSPAWGNKPLPRVPKNVRADFETAYGNIEVNKWYHLPKCLHSLGVYNVRNKSVAIALSDLPGYSDSTLHTAQDVLFALDFGFTSQQMDQYWGKTRGLIPEEMQPKKVIANGVEFTEAVQQAPLEDDIYRKIDNGMSKEPIKPTFFQADIRTDQHKFARDALLEMLASKVGLSSSTLANHLTNNGSKTATEVSAEEDTTTTSVNIKRGLAAEPINQMLRDISAWFGLYDENITLEWNISGTNTATEIREMRADMQAGVLPKREYIRRRYHITDDEVEKWVSQAEEEAKERSALAFGTTGEL